jgi:hypothetical protein
MTDKRVYGIDTRRRLPEPPATPDDLLSVCAAFTSLQDEKRALFDTIPDDRKRERKIVRIETRQEPLVERLTELRATSMQEHAARARSVAHYIGEDQLREDADTSACWHTRLTAAVLRDLAAEPAPAGDDTELLALCRQFDADTQALRRYDARALATPWTDQGALDLISARWHEAMYRITALPARTMAGVRAKGAVFGHALTQCVAIEPDESGNEQGEDYEHLGMSLVRDLAAVSA